MQQRLLDDLVASRAADMAACRTLLRGGSRTFYAASFLLPRKVRESASALYAFCRLADDAIDVDGGSFAAIDKLRRRLDRAYRSDPANDPIDRAFALTVASFALPRELPEALIEGLAWDAQGRRYDDLTDLTDYAARVAGSVGAMMAVVMGVRDPRLIARATDLGIAMQLTNIARDIGEDARAGRLYLPCNWMREAGLDPDSFLARPVFSPALGGVVARLLDVADALYARSESGTAGLPRGCRPGIRAARLLYAEIGNELRKRDLDSIAQRTVVSTSRKLPKLGRALFALPSEPVADGSPCLAEAHFLADAISASPCPTSPASKLRWWDLYGQAIWVIALFERLQRRAENETQTAYQNTVWQLEERR